MTTDQEIMRRILASRKAKEEAARQEADEDGICPDCSGSGEGMYDGTTCRSCRGKGVTGAQHE